MNASPQKYSDLPLEAQLKAVTASNYKEVISLLQPYGFDWNPKTCVGSRGEFRKYFSFTRAELVEFLRNNPAATQRPFSRCEADVIGHDTPYVLRASGIYFSGWADHGVMRDPRGHRKIEEAAADYYLSSYGFSLEGRCMPKN